MAIAPAEFLLRHVRRESLPESKVDQIQKKFAEVDKEREVLKNQAGFQLLETSLSNLEKAASPGQKFSFNAFAKDLDPTLTEQSQLKNADKARKGFVKEVLLKSGALPDYQTLADMARTFTKEEYSQILSIFQAEISHKVPAVDHSMGLYPDTKEGLWVKSWDSLINGGDHLRAYDIAEKELPPDFDPNTADKSLMEMAKSVQYGQVALGVAKGMRSALGRAISPKNWIKRADNVVNFVRHPKDNTKALIEKIKQNETLRENIKDPLFVLGVLTEGAATGGIYLWTGGTGGAVWSGVEAVALWAATGGMALKNRSQERSLISKLVEGGSGDLAEDYKRAVFEVTTNHGKANKRLQKFFMGAAAGVTVRRTLMGGLSVEQRVQDGVLGMIDQAFGPNAIEKLGEKVAQETAQGVAQAKEAITTLPGALQEGTDGIKKVVEVVPGALQQKSGEFFKAAEGVVPEKLKERAEQFSNPRNAHASTVPTEDVGISPQPTGDEIPGGNNPGSNEPPSDVSARVDTPTEPKKDFVSEDSGIRDIQRMDDGNQILSADETAQAAERVSGRVFSFVQDQPEYKRLISDSIGQNVALVDGIVKQTLANSGVALDALPEVERDELIAQTRSQVAGHLEQIANEDFAKSFEKTVAELETTDPALYSELKNKSANDLVPDIKAALEGQQTPYADLIQKTQDNFSQTFANGTHDPKLLTNLATSTQEFLDQNGRFPNPLERGTVAIDQRHIDALQAVLAESNTQIHPYMEKLTQNLQQDPDFQKLFYQSTIGTDLDVATQLAYKSLDSAGISVGDLNNLSPEAYNALLAEIRTSMIPYESQNFKNALDTYLSHVDQETKNKILNLSPDQFQSQLTEALSNPDVQNDLSPIVAETRALNEAAWNNPEVRNGLVDFANNKLEQFKNSLKAPEDGAQWDIDLGEGAAKDAIVDNKVQLNPELSALRPTTDEIRRNLEGYFTEHEGSFKLEKIDPGETVSHMLVDNGYDVKWNSSDAKVFGAHIAANIGLLQEFWDEGARGGPYPVKLENLGQLIADAEKGDEEARKTLVNALNWVPEGGNFRVINEEALPEIIEKIGVPQNATV
jgi:hypothetical protein